MTTNEFIHQLDRDLGRDRTTTSPRELPTLPGTAAEACLLPRFKSATDFHLRYGGLPLTGEDPHSLQALSEVLDQCASVIDGFLAFAQGNVGQDVIDGARATLRSLGRLERRLEPLFAGLSFATYGRVQSACIGARAGVGDVLDHKALNGEL